MSSMPDFTRLNSVHNKAMKAAVSYSMECCESDGSYFFMIKSVAPSENWIGKNHSFDAAVVIVSEYLDGLIGAKDK